MADTDLARALFRPETIALVGASGDESKNTARPQRYLKHHGFRGRVFPINPSRKEILGDKAWPDVRAAAADAGGAIEHAYVMVPAAAVPGVIQDCLAARVRVATIYSDGFAETGDQGLAFQDDVVDTARSGGMRLLGPNSMGVVNVQAGMAMTTNAAWEAETLIPGGLSVVSQSGTALGALLSRGQARGFGFSKLFSIGNEADLSVGEVVDMLADDPETEVVLLFLETIRRHHDLADAARRAHDAGKPVLAYKLGRSPAGRLMAASHSGALAGPDEAADAFFRAHGIIRVDTLEGLLETPNLVRGRGHAKARRVAVMTTTGGGAATVVDRLGLAGVEFALPPIPVIERLGELDIRIGDAPVVDLTMAGARPEVYGPVLGELIADDGNDVVVCVVGSSAQFRPDVAVEPIIAGAAKSRTKPVAAFCVPEAGDSLRALADAGIAAFRTPESCADGVRAYLDWTAAVPPAGDGGVDLGPVAELLKGVGPGGLNEAGALSVFAALGVPTTATRVLTDAELADTESLNIDFPVAVKVLSAAIAHKTDAEGVVLDVGNATGLRDAAAAVTAGARKAHPRAAIAGVLVQAMETGVAEALVGYRLDAEAGPVVVVGAGGTLTELLDDAAVRAAPVSMETALAMIAEVRGLALARGFRGRPAGDIEALAAAVVRISQLARLDDPVVAEAEINPLIVKERGRGVAAVDAVVVLAEEG